MNARAQMVAATQAVQSPARFTLYTCDEGQVLSKTWELVDGELTMTAQGGVMAYGNGEVIAVEDLSGLAKALARLGPRNAVSWGTPRHDVRPGEGFRVVTDARAPDAVGDRGDRMFARTRDNFEYPSGERAVFMIDIDGRAPGKPNPRTAQEAVAMIRDALPELDEVEVLAVPSGSACIYDAATGRELRGNTGWRLYVIVEDGSDIPRLGERLFAELWLMGEGYIKLSASGAKLERALVDKSVWQPERLDFVGGANLGEGLIQKRPAPVLIPGTKKALDSRIVPDLTAEEAQEFAQLIEAAKAASEPAAAELRSAAVAVQTGRRVRVLREKLKRDPTNDELRKIETAVREQFSALAGVLSGDHVLELRVGGRWTPVSVTDILADPDRYVGCRSRDPFDPTDGDHGGAGSIRRSRDGKLLTVTSFARGQETTYTLTATAPKGHDELHNLLSEKLLALYPAEVAARIKAQAEEDARATAEPHIADLDDWTKDGWRSLMPKGTDFEALADKWLRDRGFDPAAGEGGKKRGLVIDGMIGREELRAMVAHIARRYCFNETASHEGEVVYDLRTGSMTSTSILGKTLAALKAAVPTVTASGTIGRTVKTSVTEWLESDAWGARKSISRFDFKPGSTQLFTPGETDDTVGVNIYRPRRYMVPPIDPAEAGRRFLRFLKHLVPDEREAAFLLNHVIGVVQRPDARGQAVLMISARGGAGRGTFFQILDAMIDPRFTRSLTTQDFVGSGAQWTEWEEHTIVAHVDEMATLGGDKYKAMAELDGRIELMPSRKPVTEKGKSRRTVTVYWTFFGAAMSSDAIALEKRDRRWTILTNTNVRFGDDPGVAATVSSMQEYPKGPISEAFAHGLNLWLQAQPFDYDMFIDGIETEAKRELLEASEGDIELTLRRVLNDYLKQGKHEVWISNVALETQSRMRNVERCSDAAVKKAWTKVPELFKQGFDGWEVPMNPGGKPQALRVASSTSEGEVELKRAAGSIARHRDAPNYTAEERRDVLGDRRSR